MAGNKWKVQGINGPGDPWECCQYRDCKQRAVLKWRRWFTVRVLCKKHSDELTGGG